MANDAHIGPEQAVQVFSRLGATQAIPIHWGTFRLSNEAYDTPHECWRFTHGAQD
jgi:L-ascorbate metabolism protein UlaG (beta-lactamase superfamily)